MRGALTLIAAIPVLAGCMAGRDGPAPSAHSAHAALAGASGVARGTAMLGETRSGLLINIAAEGLPPGTHGIHLHSVGRCDAPDFQSAGPHWNPEMKQHGRDNPQGAHGGDLPNIEIGADGRGKLRFAIPEANLAGLLDADGAAVVVHAKADDYRTDPSGNSGARIACGVITR